MVAWRRLVEQKLNRNTGLQKISKITDWADMDITTDTASVSKNEREHMCVSDLF